MADVVKFATVYDLLMESAENYIEAGFSPVRAVKKAMQGEGWNKFDLQAGQAKTYFKPGDNIAIRTGRTAGGNFVTVDFDCEEAKKFAKYLPSTEMQHGREKNPYCHYTYRIDSESPCSTRRYKDVDGTSLIDLLGEGAAIIVAPSIHPGDGDQYQIHGLLEPALVEPEKLQRAVNKVYIAALSMRHSPSKGSRQDFFLALSGFLLKGGLTQEETVELVKDVARQSNDEEWEKRAQGAADTAKKFVSGEPVTGATMLKDLVDEKFVRLLGRYLPSPVAEKVELSEEIAAIVASMNKKHAVCMVGGKTTILNEFVNPDSGNHEVSQSGEADLKLRYKNKTEIVGQSANGKAVEKTHAEIWLEHPERREYEGIGFFPRGTPSGYYNLFRGFPVTPVTGDCSLYLMHVRDVICRANEELFEYLIRWMAHALQRPWELPEVAIVIRGKQGTGKTTMVDYLGKLFGQHFITVTGMKQVTGQFNGHLADKLLVCANEAIWGGDKVGEGVLKALITDSSSTIEYKFKDLIVIPNYKRLIVTTNESWAVPIGVDDRRYVVLDVSDAYKEDKAYFSALISQMENGGTQALMEYLLSIDLDEFEVRNAPYTSSSFDIKLKSADPVFEFLFECLSDQLLPDYDLEWRPQVLQSDFYKAYKSWCADNKVSHPHAQRFFTTELRKVFPGLKVEKVSKTDSKGRRPREYRFPGIDQARAQFQKCVKSGSEIWDDD